jgi:peptide/nickel transport system substrate-binding protein
MTAPIGSGPYRVTAVKPGASLTLTRNPDYWGRDLAVNRGLWNFDEIRLDFYREANGAFEAFKRGLYDFRVETEPLRWHDGYDFPAVRNGEVIRDAIKTGMPQPSEFLVFNTRRPMFADIRVRQALTLLFDFEWINRNYFFGLYGRDGGFFAGSELSAYARPEDGPSQCLGAVVAGRLRPRRRRAAPALDRNTPRLRNPGDHTRPGTHRAGVPTRSQARRHRGLGARGGRRAIRSAASGIRF